MTPPRFSLVIPTCDRPEALALCLGKLGAAEQRVAADFFEIIVTDDGRTRQASEVLAGRFPGVRWTMGPRRGPAANRNHGASLAGGDVLVFLDDDCLPEPGLLAEYARFLALDGEGAEVGAIEGRIAAERPRRRLDEEAPVNETGGLFWSCNVAVRTEVFRRVRGFDERFPHAAMEDVELRERLRRNGVKIVFLRDALVVHPLRRLAGWPSLRRRAMAHGIYMQMETRHFTPWGYLEACRRFLRSWRQILTDARKFGLRGLGLRAQYSLFSFLCVREMKKTKHLPRLPSWDRVGGRQS